MSTNTDKDWTLRYFPERFRRRHNLEYRKATQLLGRDGLTRPTLEAATELQNLVVAEYTAVLRKMPLEARPRRATAVASVLSTSLKLGSFHLGGRQIYDFSRRMLPVLASADYHDVPVGMLVSPFPTVYLHFGPQPFAIKGEPFEGAIVTIDDGVAEFTFVTAASPGWMAGDMVSHPHNYLYLSFRQDEHSPNAPLGDVVAQAVAAERQKLQEFSQIPQTTIERDGMVIVDRIGAGAAEDLKAFELGVESLDDAMNLVVNSLIYIMAYREHVHTRWTENTPEDVSKVADGSGRPKQVLQARARTIDEGYYKAHFVGERSEHGDDAESPPIGRAIAPHWRRAHWRLQACGTGRQDRKLVLVKRVLVNATILAAGAEVSGRVSVVT